VSDSEPQPTGRRPLTLVAAIALVVANMVGTGIFTSTGYMAFDLGGTPILLAWAVGGVLALCGAAVYGELGAMMPRAGGEYVYLSEAFRPWVGFLSGWVSLVVGFSAPIAAAANAFGAYLGKSAGWIHPTVAGVALIAVITLLHCVSVVLGARVQTFFSLLKVALIVFFIVAGLLLGDGDLANLSVGSGADAITSSAFAVSLVYISFSYSGWNAAAYMAGEIENPGRNLPLALLIGTGLVTALYVLLNVVFLYAVPAPEMAGTKEVGELAATSLFGGDAGRLLSLLIAIALISSVSAMVMAGPRVYMVMAEDGMFFRQLASKNAGGSPVFSVLLQGALAIGLLLIARFDQLVNYIGFTLSIFATLTVIGAFVLRIKQPDAPRPYRTLGWPVTPILFVALNLWMVYFLVDQKPVESAAGAGTLLAGGLVFLFWRRHFARGARRDSAGE
jgi:APA family basic amino acid/polyamine antiporter